MKVIKVTLLFLFLSITCKSANAQMMVFDAACAAGQSQKFNLDIAHYAKQMVQLTNTTSNTLKSLEFLSMQTQQLDRQLESITGNLNLSSPLLTDIQNVLDNYASLTTALPSKTVNGKAVDNKETEGIKVLLKDITSDHSDRRADVYEPLRQKYVADSQHAALTLSEFVINNGADNIKAISEDVKNADSNQRLKEAIDVNNKILLQLATTQQQQTQLLAHLLRSMISKDFRGTYPTAKKRAKSRMEDVQDSFNGDKINFIKTPFSRSDSFTRRMMEGRNK